MAETTEYASFLVRIWREPDQEDPAGSSSWTAEVESIQSGDAWRFADVASLLAFFKESFPAVNDGAGSAS